MFIKDGKNLFGNWGLIISLAILVILLFFSYNKCMIPLEREEFTTPSTTIPSTTSKQSNNVDPFPPPQNPRINIIGSTITLNFTVSSVAGTPIPIQFMIVLVQYDSTITPTGNNKFYISNENIINSSISNISTTPDALIKTNTNTSLCQLVNGSPSCQYIFNNLDMVDTAGNPYYYKIGISAVYTNGNSRFVLPYNVVNKNGIFSLTTSLDGQNNQFNDYIKYKQIQTQMKSANYGSTVATPDGQYELIKSQLGGYPSNLIMDPTSAKQNILADLVDKSMAQAVLNVSVNQVSNN